MERTSCAAALIALVVFSISSLAGVDFSLSSPSAGRVTIGCNATAGCWRGKMKKTFVLTAILAVVLCLSATVLAACPSADFSGDCKVNLDDFALLASGWLTTYDADDLADMGFQWLDNGAFITTWNTRLRTGTTVTLALADTVDAVIDWGDGTISTVTTSGPHVHD